MINKPLLIDTGKGLSVNYKNRYLYSKYNPLKGIEKVLIDKRFNDNTIYLVPSPLLGYGMDMIRQNLPKTSIIVLIEVDSNLFEISDQDLTLTLILNGFDFIDIIKNINFSNFRKCELIKINGSYDLYKNEYDRLFNILINHLHNYWKNRYTLTQMGQLWTKNCFNNLKDLHKAQPVSKLKTDKPMVIIGAGESAESILDILKEFRESIFILCVDTALQILLESNITPDVVLALEAQYYNLPDFYGAKNRTIDLIYDLSSYPAVPRTISGKRYYTVTKFSESSLLHKLDKAGIVDEFIPPLGSVGITALYLGFKITNNNIFIAGLDFSYIRGKSHSRGTPYHKTTMLNWSRLFPGDNYTETLKRPLITKKNKIGIMENSDTILYEYSLHAKELLYGIQGVFDLTRRGMDLGIELINTESFIFKLKKDKNIVPEYRISQDTTNNSDFYKEEYNHLSIAIKKVEDAIWNNTEITKILPYLRKIEYIFEHYPENKPLDQLNLLNLKRYYYTLVRFKRLIK